MTKQFKTKKKNGKKQFLLPVSNGFTTHWQWSLIEIKPELRLRFNFNHINQQQIQTRHRQCRGEKGNISDLQYHIRIDIEEILAHINMIFQEFQFHGCHDRLQRTIGSPIGTHSLDIILLAQINLDGGYSQTSGHGFEEIPSEENHPHVESQRGHTTRVLRTLPHIHRHKGQVEERSVRVDKLENEYFGDHTVFKSRVRSVYLQ
jgi:hypothetical protein